MKQKFLKSISLILIICCVFIFAGCNGENTNESTEPSTTPQVESDNPLMGTWQFVNENGENHTLFSYIFQDEKTAIMAMGNVAFYSDLKLDKNDEGEDTLTAQLYYNINGTYVYEISEDGKTMNIKEEGSDSEESLVMSKVDDYKFMPEASENPEIDEKLIGNWQDKEGSGITYTFNENGTLENDSYGVMKIYARYSAKDGKLTYKYNQGTAMEDTYDYSFNGDVLIIDEDEFIKQ